MLQAPQGGQTRPRYAGLFWSCHFSHLPIQPVPQVENLLGLARSRAFGSAVLSNTSTQSGVSCSRSCHHVDTVRCGSVSRMSVRRFTPRAATAKLSARVDFPHPPFCVTSAITCIVLSKTNEREPYHHIMIS